MSQYSGDVIREEREIQIKREATVVYGRMIDLITERSEIRGKRSIHDSHRTDGDIAKTFAPPIDFPQEVKSDSPPMD